jgi:starch phosphorylase
MTALALRTANFVNGVSQLHGQVTREMWAPIWPGVQSGQHPVRAITNGIHVPTWMSLEMAALLDEYLPADWRDRADDPSLWEAVAYPRRSSWEAQALRRTLAFLRTAPASGGKRNTSRPRASSPPARWSTRARSPSASPAASPATNAQSSSSRTRTVWSAS